jgi:hypothetical protein
MSEDPEDVVNSLVVNWLFPILIVIVGAGYPPVDVQVHVLCWSGAGLLVPVSVGVCGDATRKTVLLKYEETMDKLFSVMLLILLHLILHKQLACH